MKQIRFVITPKKNGGGLTAEVQQQTSNNEWMLLGFRKDIASPTELLNWLCHQKLLGSPEDEKIK